MAILKETENGLMLCDGELSMMGDFTKEIPRLKRGVIGTELLVKACKIKNKDNPTVLDATAGMGEDSLLLAAAGFSVQMYEYNPVIAALLRDTMKRAMEDEFLGPIVERMTLTEGDSIRAMKEMKPDEAPDVILLDPMFPERTKSALIKKKFQLIHTLESPCENEGEMLNAAMTLKPKKLVIKRPLKGATLAGVKPSYSLNGKAIRYDVIVNM